MNPIGVLLLMIVIGAATGVVLYLITDITNYKKKVSDELEKQKMIATDVQETSIANLKYVVDQVNTVNDDIYNTYTSNVNPMQSSLSNMQQSIHMTGSNITLLQNVVATMGLTAKDIDVNKNQVNFCGAGANSGRCIKFPGPTGDVEIRAFDASKSVLLGSPVNMQFGGMSSNAIGVGDAMTSYAHLSNAYLTVKASSAPKKNLITVDKGDERVMEINSSGLTTFSKPVRMNAREGVSLMNSTEEASKIQFNTNSNALIISGVVDIPKLRVNGKTITIEDIEKLKAITTADIDKLKKVSVNSQFQPQPKHYVHFDMDYLYIKEGSYVFTVPDGITALSVICIGGGGGGTQGAPAINSGGGGGGCTWVNKIPTTSGTQYRVIVGHGGSRGLNANAGNGGNSIFMLMSNPSKYYVFAGGGEGGKYNTTVNSKGGVGGWSYVAGFPKVKDQCSGGHGGEGVKAIAENVAAGGGGAGGYNGPGGFGAGNTTGSGESATGASGGNGTKNRNASGGGGTGLYGYTGTAAARTDPGSAYSGSRGSPTYPGPSPYNFATAGYPGVNGDGTGGNFGGGGGSCNSYENPGLGGRGAVRIICHHAGSTNKGFQVTSGALVATIPTFVIDNNV